MKKIITKQEARKKLQEGTQLMYDVVCTTLGPKGRNVAISRQWGAPIIVHDGVTCARDVESKDEFVNMGINLVREAAQKTNDEAGDGTTTSTLLAHQMVVKGMKLLEDGINPMILRGEILAAMEHALSELKKIATPTKKQKDLERVAFISSADAEIGKMVGEAVSKVGEDGLVSVEEGFTQTEVEYTEGMEVDKGFISPYLVTNPQRMEAVVEDAYIVVTDKKVTTQMEIVPLLEALVRRTKNIVIFGDVTGEALKVIAQNKVNGTINALVVPTPGFGEQKTGYLQDICVATGARLISDELGLSVADFAKQFNLEWVGRAKRVVANRKTTIILGGGGDKKVIEKYLADLRELKKKEQSMFETEKIEERIAKITSGVAVIKVGAKTELEMRERVERVKDAVGAAKAALEEGIVPGGGVAFLKMANAVSLGDKTVGGYLMVDVLREPIRKLLSNAGEGEKEIDSISREIVKRGGDWGYEVNSGKMVDLVSEGVVDPAKVIRLAVQNAVSVATSILTTDVLIVDETEKQNEK